MDSLEVSRRIYDRLAELSQAPPPRVRAWNGDTWGPENASATLVLQHPGALRALLVPPSDLTAGEAYLYDDVDVEGDMVALVEFAAGLQKVGRRGPKALRLMGLARSSFYYRPETPDEALAMLHRSLWSLGGTHGSLWLHNAVAVAAARKSRPARSPTRSPPRVRLP